MRRARGGYTTDSTDITVTTVTNSPTVAAASGGGGGGGGGGVGLPATKEGPFLPCRAVRQVVRGKVVRESATIRGVHVAQIRLEQWNRRRRSV